MPTETLEAPSSEITTSINPIPGAEMPEGLRNLLDRVLPSESGSDTGEQDESVVDPDAPTEEKSDEPKPADKPEEKKVEPVKPPAETRLAPDLSAKPGEKTDQVVEEVDLKPLDALIEGSKSPKQKGDLSKFRELLKTTIAENATLKAKPPAPAEDTGQQAMIEKLRSDNHELLAKVERFDLLAKPAIQRDLVQPRNKMYGDAKALLKEAGADPEALDRAIGLVGKSKTAVLDELALSIESPILRDRFGRLMDGIDDKNRAIGEALRDARANNEKLSKQETIDRHEAILKQEAELKTSLQIARRDLAENAKLPMLIKTGSKDFEWWDKDVDEIDALAEHFMLRATPDMLPKIAYGAACLDKALDMFNAERKARKAAEKRLAEIEGAEPVLGEDKRKPKDSDVPEDADIKTAVFAHLRSGKS